MTATDDQIRSAGRMPDRFYQTLFPSQPEPPFEDSAELEAVWGAPWGAHDDVGPLRAVLMRPPSPALADISADAYDPDLGALVNAEEGWYWTDSQPPDLDLVRQQHEGLVAALKAEGVQVHLAPPLPGFSKSMYTRDPMVAIPGGAVVGRMAPRMRRGEERTTMQAVAALGMPIVRTITGRGLLEGGTVAKLDARHYAYGVTIRCNLDAARQLEELLRWLGIELILVPVSGFNIHLDGQFGMVDVDKALINPPGLPYTFIEQLPALGIEPIICHPDERWAINSLAVRPGRIIMCDAYPYTAERLERRGVEVIRIPYSEIQKNGGGIHCSTMELLRERAM